MSEYPWERPLGARPLADGRTEFRVWAPSGEPRLILDPQRRRGSIGPPRTPPLAMEHVGHGVYELAIEVASGTDYCYLVGGRRRPDPASRWQPYGLRGPSRVYAPASAPVFMPKPMQEQVIYELHVGTFSEQGTFAGAIPHLAELAALGVTAIELMPVAEFPGARGWGYDGVYLSAAQSSYGGPVGLQELVRAAHDHGLAVILDVVYNHVGASGNGALEAFGPYFTAKYETFWGRAINYDDARCDPVREWVVQSAEGWVRDFGIDGLRLDAIHAIFDGSPEHIVAAVTRRVHALAPGRLVIAESGRNDPIVTRAAQLGGYGCDGAWADDFHHALRTLTTDEHDGYYADFGQLTQLAKAFHRPHVFDGNYSPVRRRRFGAPAQETPVERFVVFCQNHDQVGNRAFGDRLPHAARALSAFCVLLSPFTPMLFMGEEYGEDAPFQFFCDHIDKRIADATRRGRRAEFAAFAAFGQEIPDPQAQDTFLASKLTRAGDPALAALYRELLAVRRLLPVGEASDIRYDSAARWLRVVRGGHELVCNFGSDELELSVVPGEARMILATHPTVALADGRLRLPALGGALLATEPAC
ncbi:malto-oligosyltrehalose trehalohydrolase [Conexibacter sp. S30A1]|uniref:malto-oligosyltrehalose trehalohydrolase n=1 Tax=Conexibacter sp. S30A1 TaxID=2937800 RepID=UPI00200EFC6B|nr:malto-oligosyltrehalose trehalohydrolase [Conexibacter sp. S30A1]